MVDGVQDQCPDDLIGGAAEVEPAIEGGGQGDPGPVVTLAGPLVGGVGVQGGAEGAHQVGGASFVGL